MDRVEAISFLTALGVEYAQFVFKGQPVAQKALLLQIQQAHDAVMRPPVPEAPTHVDSQD